MLRHTLFFAFSLLLPLICNKIIGMLPLISNKRLFTLTLTDFTLHFSCCFTNLLHSHFVPLLNNFTMQEKCY